MFATRQGGISGGESMGTRVYKTQDSKYLEVS